MRMAVALVAALVAVGCASRVSFDPPLPETREGLGKVAVIAVPAIKSSDIRRPLPRDEARAAGKAALRSVQFGGNVGCDREWQWLWVLTCPLGLAAGIAVAPVAAGGAAIVENNVAHSEQEIAFAASNVETTFGDFRPSEDLRDFVIASAEQTPDLRLSGRDDLGTDLYRSLSVEGFSTLLKVQVREFSLMLEGESDPDIVLLLGTSGELFRVSDGRLLYRRTWRYVSEERDYFEMTLDGAKPLRDGIHAGLDALARKMFNDLFVSTSPEIQVTDLKPGIPATTSAWQIQEPDSTPTTAARSAGLSEGVPQVEQNSIQEVETSTVVGGKRATQPLVQTNMEQVAKTIPQTPETPEQTHPFDGTWTGGVVMMHCNTYGAPRRFSLSLNVKSGRIHGGDPGGRYSANGEVTKDGRLEGASLNDYLLMEGSISSGTLRTVSRDCGARYALKRIETP